MPGCSENDTLWNLHILLSFHQYSTVYRMAINSVGKNKESSCGRLPSFSPFFSLWPDWPFQQIKDWFPERFYHRIISISAIFRFQSIPSPANCSKRESLSLWLGAHLNFAVGENKKRGNHQLLRTYRGSRYSIVYHKANNSLRKNKESSCGNHWPLHGYA